MGGYGSTRWGGFRRQARIHERARLNAAVFARHAREVMQGATSPVWELCTTPRATLSLEYRPELEDNGAPVVFARVKGDAAGRWCMALVGYTQPAGGRAWRWRCPRCERGVRALYQRPQLVEWSCRHCLRLSYVTQALDPIRRAEYGMRQLVKRAGVTSPETLPDFPYEHDKPRGMHWRTWDALAERFAALEAAREAAWADATARLFERFARHTPGPRWS